MDNITITKHKGDIGDIMISFFQNKSNIIMIMIGHCSCQKAKNIYRDIILFILVKVILDSNSLKKRKKVIIILAHLQKNVIM